MSSNIGQSIAHGRYLFAISFRRVGVSAFMTHHNHSQALNIQIPHIEGVVFDEFAPGFDLVAH
jgi:hypothetical protein